jgi:DNA-binding response OmpR family regulator
VVLLPSPTLLEDALEQMTPELILLDIEMPEMSGYEVLKILKANEATQNIPVIFLTSKTDGESELEGLSLGAIDYVTKPFSSSVLLKRIELHLLALDDSTDLLRTIQHILRNLYRLVLLPSPFLLESALKQKTPDLILLDIDMPGLSGYDVLKILKADEETKDIPVIFLTSNIDDESELKGLLMGAADYITKPFSSAILLKRVEMQLLVEAQKKEIIRLNEKKPF